MILRWFSTRRNASRKCCTLLAGCLAATTASCGEGARAKHRVFAVDDFARIAAAVGAPPNARYTVVRNGGGDKILLYDTTRPRVIVVSPIATEERELPDVGFFLTESEDLGRIPKLPEYFGLTRSPEQPFGQSGVESGGRLFYAVFGRETYVGSTSTERSTKGRFELFATGLFVRNQEVFLCGTVGRRTDEVVCLVLEERGDAFTELRRFVIPNSAAVIDVDPRSEKILVQGRGDLMPSWFIFNEDDESLEWLSASAATGFFLTDALMHRLAQ